jgi:hypothetical protein
VVQEGRFDELAAETGLFAELVRRQAALDVRSACHADKIVRFRVAIIDHGVELSDFE